MCSAAAAPPTPQLLGCGVLGDGFDARLQHLWGWGGVGLGGQGLGGGGLPATGQTFPMTLVMLIRIATRSGFSRGWR